MPSYEYFVLDVFTQTRFTGNPAGVVLHDGTLSGEQMRQMAGELGLESAFLCPATVAEADYQVAYYTGAQRVPLCGHDTIASASLLAQTGRLTVPGTVRFATDVGVLMVEAATSGTVTMTQALPQYGALADAGQVAALGLDAREIAAPPQVVSTGSPFLFVPIRTRHALNALSPDAIRLTAFLNTLPDQPLGMYVWTRETINPHSFAHARCFAPGIGLPEDPVTGSASGALGAYLLRHGLAHPNADGVLTFSTEQGYVMARPGQAQVRLEVKGSEVTRVQVSGEAVLVAQGRIWV